jgi:RNA 2',3'-cyclic 3'-phosphodiesterase
MRTFIAIPLSEQTIEMIGRNQNDLRLNMGLGVSWVELNSIHLTLKFFGEVEESRISEISTELLNLSKYIQTFTLNCGGLGCFPNIRQPRILWVGIEPEKQLDILQTKIEAACFNKGFAKEGRKFSPHLTLGRIKTGLTLKEMEYLKDKITNRNIQDRSIINVKEILLYKSELKSTGAIYSVLFRAGLKLDSG